MTSILKLTPLCGVHDENPLCYLLQFDEFRFLLDCGWDEKFTMSYVENMKKYAHQIDAVLISHPDPLHLGALPYMVGKCGLNCPIYTTIPVYKMGQMFMYDIYQSRQNTEDFTIFTLDDVDAAFDKIVQLKYSQNVPMKGKGHGLTITPLPAGHMIGGTVWRIVKEGEEDVVYAVDYNHKKERHLNGCVLEGINRPCLLITDAYNANYVQLRRKLRDEQLLTEIFNTVRDDGNVLVSIDTAGRVLELSQLLEQYWQNAETGLQAYNLCLLNNVAYNVVEFAKSQVEWMSDKIMRVFEDNRNNPFQFKHLKLCHSLSELHKVPDPKVVLASVPDLESGFSRELFVQWCHSPKNTVVLTSRPGPGTLGRMLIENPKMKTFTLQARKRVRLEGPELEEYLQEEKKEKEEKKRRESKAKGDESDTSESDDEMEVEGSSFPAGAKGVAKHDLMMKGEGGRKGGFFKQAKKAYPMFPAPEERIKWDDYGEIIKPEDFMVVEMTQAEEEKAKAEGEAAAQEEFAEELTDVPTKSIVQELTLDIKCRVVYIDFEGRSDGESMKKIMSQLKPRQLVIVHGNSESTLLLAEVCRSTAGMVQGKVFTPKLNETVDATMESHIYQVKLKDSLVSSLQFFKARDTELAWVDGQLDLTTPATDTSALLEEGEVQEMEEEEEQKKKGKSAKSAAEESRETVPTLEALPVSQIPGHEAVFINKPRLSDIKQVLQKEGIQAEFSGGVLICNNVVALKRNESGRIGMEGCICEDYYKVRKLLYEQYAIV
ncbi:CPSF2 [Branchiostoma lanceolatum]|uniref:Cleavage and polyadenylation specificity factor subunit 2 n=1 Tax=Branchiostoma lanceolatum TaxID=7740 RepID=A0A8J9ZT34_BRALA|nr:CPSF2 [Branchiostoma lanceolatum]